MKLLDPLSRVSGTRDNQPTIMADRVSLISPRQRVNDNDRFRERASLLAGSFRRRIKCLDCTGKKSGFPAYSPFFSSFRNNSVARRRSRLASGRRGEVVKVALQHLQACHQAFYWLYGTTEAAGALAR